MGMSTCWIIFLQLSTVLAHGYDDVGFDGWYQPVPHRPVDIITDVINDLGVRILQQYTAHGNVAFSPSGVGFVLAALYEGSSGRGSQQIADALGLPRDRDITRIGFRDIHRRLRTYLNADGFLGGLTLNREDITLRPEYEDLLRFYGFDLTVEEETNETTSMPETTSPMDVNSTTDRPTEEDTASSIDATTMPVITTESMSTENSMNENEATSSVELLGTTLSTPNLQERLTESTTIRATLTDDLPSTFSETISPNTEISTSPSTETITTIASSTERTTTEEVAAVNETTTDSSKIPDSTTTVESIPSNGQTTNSPTTVKTSEVVSEISESTTVSSTTNEPVVTTIFEKTTTTMILSSNTASINVTQDSVTTIGDLANGTTNGPPADENTVSTDLSNNETDTVTASTEMGSTDLTATSPITGEAVTVQNQRSNGVPSTTDDSMNRVRKRSVRSPRGYFSSYPDEGIWMQDLGIWKPYVSSLTEASVRDSTEISFLVNGCDLSSVTATRYVAVLPFAYFPSLHAVVLEFPLDDPRYNIILLMATDRRDTYRLARDLGGKSLRLLRKQLQPTWVRATIPSFMLRGFVTLTSFLQRLGIVDVFEPRAADLSPMTPDLGVYARDVQQSIGVNIRNYMKPDRTHSRNGLFERASPVPFTTVHPFLYFIVDAETSVALIAGRVNDPLNSRIL